MVTKTCKRCGQGKPLTEFSRNRVRKDGWNDWCKKCTREWRREKKKVDPDMERRVKVKQLYGLTLEEYNTIMALPCAICGNEAEHLDHCHTSGKPRAALCQNCNLMLGLSHDNPARLRAAADYLEEHV